MRYTCSDICRPHRRCQGWSSGGGRMDFSSQFAEAERLIAAGKLDEAKTVIRGVLAQDKRNPEAWYLASRCISDPKARAEALRRVLLSDPSHAQASVSLRRWMAWQSSVHRAWRR